MRFDSIREEQALYDVLLGFLKLIKQTHNFVLAFLLSVSLPPFLTSTLNHPKILSLLSALEHRFSALFLFLRDVSRLFVKHKPFLISSLLIYCYTATLVFFLTVLILNLTISVGGKYSFIILNISLSICK